MDGFDDLLTPSQSSLEDNPFADPFAKRSASPDPWTSPFARQQPADAYDYEQHRSTTPPPESPVSAVEESPVDLAVEGSPDPLAGPLSPQTPGFRESVPESDPTFSEIATIRPTEPEELQSSIPIPGTEDDERPRTVTPTPATPPPRLSESAPSLVPPSPSTDRWGPLDSPAPITRSYPNLALGGEPEWQENWSNDRSPPTRLPTEDDSDDDKPVLQTVRHPERADTLKPTKDGLPPIFQISVDDPQKVGDPIRSFTMYTVHTRTTSPLFQKSAFSVLRRYSDFLWLYETLSTNNPGVVVPPVPEKNTFGRFDDQFVRQRRFALEKCIHKIANHPVLGKDPDLKLFLESDTFALDIKHRKAEIAQERGGLMATIGQSLAGPRFYETDEWFDRQKAYLDSLEAQLRGLVKAIESVSKQRVEMSAAIAEFAVTVTDLSASDVGKQLAHSLAGLAEVERKAQDLQSLQAEQDVVTLLSTVDEYARLINSVRLAFNSRIRTYHSWRAAEAELLRVKQAHERNRAQGRGGGGERAGYSLAQVSESERRSLDAKHEFDQATKLIKTEVARFEQERVEDFKDSLHAFLEGMIGRQKELIMGWETYQQMLLKRGGRGMPGGSGLNAGQQGQVAVA
ncbi:Vps5 C terminal like-domain-containing protein [Mycena alexandri]|uniref:Vps5 C terminal like-domain-containing protein n=1 Tax=Mycena alexandri TaxID=1745969 RepID=A0AAD6XBD8_9AGAR|nr:Vps5 C terminal like-domain-containing protein [Mycena alexandri]